MKQLRHVLALTLVFCMVFGMVTPSLAVSGEISVEEDYGIPVEEDGGIEIEVDDRSDYDIDEDREELSVLPKQDETADETNTTGKVDGYNYNIIHLDCGRKYFSVDSIKQIIDNASAAGFNYIQLAVGNDGMRFLLDDMSLTVNGTEYDGTAITAAIKAANKAYYDAGDKNELTQSEMDTIIAYAKSKGMGVIPLINTPGHMDAILAAANKVTGTDCSYNSSVRTIDVTNPTAVAFTKAFLTKYITYFAGEGCTLFNMGADEYANDKYANENGMGFGVLQRSGQYGDFVSYVNDIAKAITKAGMRPMAFNDGIYYGGNTSSGTFDTDIIIEYWSSGWSSYKPMPASDLAAKGFKMVNTHGDYYWVLGKPDAQCSATKARGFDKTVFPGSTISNPGGSTFCIWSDYPGAETEASVITKTADTIEAFGGTLPNLNPTVTVSVNQTVERTQDGVNNENNVDRREFDESIATVVVTGTDAVEGNVSYNSSRYYYSQVTGENSSPTKTIYYYNVGDNYYPVYAYRTSSYYGYQTNYYIGYSTTDSADNVQFVVNGETRNRSITLYTKSGTDPVPASTTIAITGKTVGTTYITVGGVRYTIKVLAQDLADVTPITVEYWITNDRVKSSATGATSRTIAAHESTVYSENGALFSELVPATGTRWNDGNNTINMVYWKGTRLVSGSEQTTDPGDDKTGSGDDFNYIRYWDGKWSFFSTKSETWENFNTSDQIVAYYLQRTEVTDEINTEVVDWGEERSGYGSSNFVLMDYAVMYQSGERLPGTFPVANKTIAFHCDPNDTNTVKKYSETSTQWYNYYRQIGMIRGQETSDYEVYMITLTPTSTNKNTPVANYASSATSYEYDYSNEKVIWVDDIANLGDFADESKWYTSVSGDAKYGFSKETSVGGMPIVPGVEITNRHGLLVTYYIRAKATPESLTVHYMDRTNGDKEFYSYPIIVNKDTRFKDGPYLPEEPEANGIPTHIKNGDVVNSLGKTQYVSSVFATMPEINVAYRYSSYECVEVVRSDDGKDLYLYYNFKDTHSFVVDFGVPLHLTTNDIAISGNWTSYTATQGKYGTVEYNGTQIGGGITYTPTEVMQGRDEIAVTLNGENGKATHFIYLYPATNVLYEEDVITNPGTEWTTVNDNNYALPVGVTTQSAEKLGEENLHGYDDYYSENTEFSGGTAYKATLDVSKTATEYGNPLTFEFTGNGFDLISECGPQTGALLVRVYKDGVLNHGFFVDTYFTGDNTGIINSAAADNNGVLDYQVPVVRDINLTHGTYKVEVYGYMVNRSTTSTASLYSVDSAETYLEQALRDLGLDDDASLYEVSFMDENSVLNDNAVASDVVRSGVSVQSMADEVMAATDNTQYVYVDGIRVYHTIDAAAEPEYTASEQDVTYYDIYDIAKKSGMTIGSYLVYVEGEGNRATLENYHNKGPQNEIYLTSGNTLAFKLDGYTENQINLKSIQISARAVTEEAAFVDNGKPIPIATNTEMYYSVQLLTTSDTKEYYLSIKCPKNTDGTNSMLSIGAIKLPNGVTIAEATESVKADVLRRAKAQDSDEFIPSSFTVNVAESVKAGKRFYLGAQTSIDVDKLIVEYQGVEYEITPDNAELVSRGVADVYTYSSGFKAPKRGVADSVTVTVKAHKAGTDDVYSTPVTYTVVVK